MEDIEKVEISVGDDIELQQNCGRLLGKGDIFNVQTINKDCFHITGMFKIGNKLNRGEICVDREISNYFKVIKIEDIEINLNDILK